MIDKDDVEKIGRILEPAGQATVGITGHGVAAGMIVHEDEGIGFVGERLLNHFTRMCRGFIDRAAKQLFMTHETEPCVQQKNAHRLMIQGLKLGADEPVGMLRRVQRHFTCLLLFGAPPKLKGCREMRRFRRAQRPHPGQFDCLDPRQISQRALLTKQTLRHLKRVLPLDAGVDENGQQLRIRQSSGTKPQQPLTRTVFFRNIMNAGHGGGVVACDGGCAISRKVLPTLANNRQLFLGLNLHPVPRQGGIDFLTVGINATGETLRIRESVADEISHGIHRAAAGVIVEHDRRGFVPV